MVKKLGANVDEFHGTVYINCESGYTTLDRFKAFTIENYKKGELLDIVYSDGNPRTIRGSVNISLILKNAQVIGNLTNYSFFKNYRYSEMTDEEKKSFRGKLGLLEKTASPSRTGTGEM